MMLDAKYCKVDDVTANVKLFEIEDALSDYLAWELNLRFLFAIFYPDLHIILTLL